VLAHLRVGNHDVSITGCWANINAPGAAHRMHAHPNNFLSGVYYVQVQDRADTINFHDPRAQTAVIRPAVTELTAYNTDQVVVAINTGTLIVFPAWLLHSVDTNQSELPRISISFNVMFGEFPKDFPEGQVKYFYLDNDRNIAEFAPGIEIPLRPFPGTLGVARAEPGRYNAVPPGPYAGNLDNRDLVEGTTLYVPVFVRGALVWTGDSHAAQGNGEVNLTALETAFEEITLTITVDKATRLQWPRIETPTEWITMGFDEDLTKALANAKSETAKFLAEQRKISPEQALALVSTTSDCRVTQVVDIKKGVHCMSSKDTSKPLAAPWPTTETADYLVTYAGNSDMNKAMDTASWSMIELLQKQKSLSRLDAYSLASMTMDCRVGEMDAPEKGVHCLVPKSLWVKR